MAKSVRLNRPRRGELNYDFASFNDFVLREIKAGYKDKKGVYHACRSADEVDVENNYQLQRPEELLTAKIGWCFDLVELYREYAFAHKLAARSYFLEYYDESKRIHFVSAFIIVQQKDGKWYECSDNLEDAFHGDKTFNAPREAVSQNFYEFKHYVREVVDSPRRDFFYMNEYSQPDKAIFAGEMEIIDWCRIEQIRKEKDDDVRKEVSSMAIVFAKGEEEERYCILLLKTNHNEWVFPKGHIEGKETSKQAAMRECEEEAGVNIKNATYLGYVDKYKYRFDAYDLELTKDMFYEVFGTNAIEKRVEVHAFYLPEKQKVKWLKEERFIDGAWIDVDEAIRAISFPNALELYRKAYNKFARKYLKKNRFNEILKDVIKPFIPKK